MARKQSLLDPPMTGWRRDLPAPNDLPEPIHVTGFDHPPNHMDDIYLELPRSSLWIRGMLIWGGGVMIACSIFLTFNLIADFAFIRLSTFFAGVATIAITLWLGLMVLRLDLSPPRDEPIRFNRARRKVYVYRFHQCWWNPFSRTRWFVRPEAYDWEDLRAEQFVVYVPGVAYNNGVNIVVVEPGTNKVRDRFLLSHNGASGANYWAIAQTFMQQGPHALPKFDRPPRDWNNEAPGMNLARRFAPKVRWPEAMDIESRTAP